MSVCLSVSSYLPLDALLARHMLCPSVRPSVCMFATCRLDAGSRKRNAIAIMVNKDIYIIALGLLVGPSLVFLR